MHGIKCFRTTICIALAITGSSFCINASAANVTPLISGDSFYSFFWTQSTGDSTASGYYGYLSTTGQKQESVSATCSAKFKLDRCSWWQSLVTHAFSDLAIVFTNSKPDSIVLCSGKFASVPWLRTINGSTDTSNYLLHFYFPVLPVSQSYNRYDYFSVRYNDSISIQFQANSDSVFAGSFISRQPGKPTVIYAKNAITIQTTSKNNLRIKSLQIKGEYAQLVSSYLGFDLLKLKKDAACYGISILDTIVPEQIIQVKSVTLSGAPNVSADSTYRLSWSFAAANIVDRCSLYVALDSGAIWMPAGMTSGQDSTIKWTAPHKKSPHAFIKVRATGKDGQKAEALSAEFSIAITGPVDSVKPPENKYLLQTAILDSTTVRLAWSLQGALDPKVFRIGIRFDTVHFPTSMADSLTKSLGVFGTSDTSDTVRNLQQGHTYYFSLFVVDTAGNWSTATTTSMARIRLGTTTGQPVVIGVDTQRVLNNSILIWSTKTLQTPYYDTLNAWDGPLNINGFVQTGPGFDFRQGRLPSNTSVGLKITYLTIAPPLKPLDQRLYQYNIYTGKWRINEAPVVIDTINHTLTTTCNDLSLPFMVMIDTLAPVTLERLNSQKIFSVNERIVDTFIVKDNIENVALRLLASPGSQGYSDISLYVTPGQNQDEYLTSIPPYIADQNSGLRCVFIIDDGLNADTINLSRPILRDGANCDETIAMGMQWTPLFVTAQPEKPSLSAVLSSSTDPTPPLNYNKEIERIIQWLPQPENSTETDKWLEYEPKRDSLFKLTPGKLFWMRTRNDCIIHYGKAVVPSLADTFSIPLNASGWTDFSIPFNFRLFIGDIIGPTKEQSGAATDSLSLYQWIKTGSSYRTEPVYLNGIRDIGDLSDTIAGARAYSVYNPSSKAIPLRIAPLCAALSSYSTNGTLHKSNQPDKTWSVRIGVRVSDFEILAPLYCASTPSNNQPRYYPIPPSFSPVKTCIFDRTNNLTFGNAATGDLSSGGTKFDLVFENSSDESSPLTLVIEKESGLPPGTKAFFFSTVSGESGFAGDTLKMSLNPKQKTSAFVVVGTDEYAKKMFAYLTSKLFFRAIPIAGGIKILYSLPYNTSSVRFTMYNLNGRIVGKTTPYGRITAGKSSLMWQSQFARGFYIIEMQAIVEGSKKPYLMRQKIVYVR